MKNSHDTEGTDRKTTINIRDISIIENFITAIEIHAMR